MMRATEASANRPRNLICWLIRFREGWEAKRPVSRIIPETVSNRRGG